MKPIILAVSAFLSLSVASTTALAYSGSECEVNDCSANAKSGKGSSNTAKAQPKTKAEVKADVKAGAKTEAKNKLMENAPSPLRDVSNFLK